MDCSRKRCVTYVTKDHSSVRVSLFLMVSAGGKSVYPFAFLHGPPYNFAEDYDSSIVQCFRTNKGYMDEVMFVRILFIRYKYSSE